MVYFNWVIRVIDYIIKLDDNKLYIAKDNEYQTHDCTFQKYINRILIKRFNDLNALEKSIKKVYGYKNKIPLFIDNNNLLLCLRSYRMNESIYINFHSIKNFERVNKLILIEFHSGHVLRLKQESGLRVQMKRAREIIDSLYK